MKHSLSQYIGMTLVTVVCAACTQTDGTIPTPSDSSSSATVSSSVAPSVAGPGIDNTGLSLQVPSGFVLDTFTKDVPGARVIVKDGMNNYWVSQPSSGRVSQLEMSGSTVSRINAIFRNLDTPHGLAIDPSTGIDLYIAEQRRIVKIRLYSDAPLETIATLPAGGRHTTRTLGIGPDGRLYVSIGSTCDVCVEKDERIGILSMNKDGSDQKMEATGLRNSVFFRWRPGTQELWATEMGRDFLGDGLPPEEVNIIVRGKHYGWPYCYGDRVRDTTFEPGSSFDCATTQGPHIALPAHVAPLGLAFVPAAWSGTEFPGDLLVSEHGSWNSTQKVGYKIVRIPIDGTGNRSGEPSDFLTGWLDGSVVGRPVDLLVDGDTLLITDDKAGAVYRLRMAER